MARSFYKVDASLAVPAEPYFHEKSGTWYSMERGADGQLTQRRWRVDPDGKPIHVRQQTVDYVMGSGSHARSFLHQTARGALLELPFAWYSEGGWALSPGHDRDYALPPRAIAYECMFCHNRYPAIPPRHEESGAEPLYAGALPQGIDCQRCHGSGADHIAKAQLGRPLNEVRTAIVNPARLSSDRQMEVCLQCHLQTTALALPHSLIKPGRGPFSYSAAEPLGNFINFFDHAPGSKYKDDFEIAHSAYRLRKSKCFLESAGKMTCTTCHNPHEQARGQQYNVVCATCHGSLAGSHTKATDCVTCHMPKRRTQDVIHAVMTDHWIQRKPPAGDLLAPLNERTEFDDGQYRGPVITYYPPAPDPLLAAIAQVSQKSNLTKGLPQLAAVIAAKRPAAAEPYIELGQAYVSAGKLPSAIAAFEEALHRKPDSISALLSLGDVLTQAGQASRAIVLLTKALPKVPDEPLLWYQLGLAQARVNSIPEAQISLAKAIALDPDLAEAHNMLAGLSASRGDTFTAESEFQIALSIHPDLPEALAGLGQLLGIRGSLTASIFYLGRAAKLKPNDADVRVNYAVALASLGQLMEAESQIDAAIRLDAKLANAHYIKASILEKRGQKDPALAELQIAIRLRPDYTAARDAAARLMKGKRQ